MKRALIVRVVALLAVAFSAAACDTASDPEGTDTSISGSDVGSGVDATAAADSGGGGTPTDTAGGGGGPGVHATGSYAGTALEIHCAPPSDYTIPVQFIRVQAAGIDKWAFTCPNADGTIQLKFEVIDPVEGKTYAQPADLDAFGVSLGEPMDIQPPGKYATNLVEMTATLTALDGGSKHLAGTLRASWSDDGSGKFGEIQGTFDVAPWE